MALLQIYLIVSISVGIFFTVSILMDLSEKYAERIAERKDRFRYKEVRFIFHVVNTVKESHQHRIYHMANFPALMMEEDPRPLDIIHTRAGTLVEQPTIQQRYEPMMSQTLNDWPNDEQPFRRVDSSPEETGSLPFLKTFRNPCWLETDGSNTTIKHLRCLPYFFLAGFPKCGTTDLHRRLILHPLISGRCKKEFHWLSRKRFKEDAEMLSTYLAYFNRNVEYDISRIQSNGFHTAIFGDCSASTVWDNEVILKQVTSDVTEPKLKNANVVFGLNPRAKIIIMLRDPIQRLYSAYAYFNKGNLTVYDFHNRTVNKIYAFKRCLKTHHIHLCAAYYSKGIGIQVGMYSVFIEDYLRVFPRNQIMIIKLEDFTQNKFNYMKDIFEFLEIGMPPSSIMDKIVQKPKQNTNLKKQKTIGDMLPTTRRLLESFYEPFNQRLLELLGKDFNYNTF